MEGRIPGAPQTPQKRRVRPERLSQERVSQLAAHLADEPRIKQEVSE